MHALWTVLSAHSIEWHCVVSRRHEHMLILNRPLHITNCSSYMHKANTTRTDLFNCHLWRLLFETDTSSNSIENYVIVLAMAMAIATATAKSKSKGKHKGDAKFSNQFTATSCRIANYPCTLHTARLFDSIKQNGKMIDSCENTFRLRFINSTIIDHFREERKQIKP